MAYNEKYRASVEADDLYQENLLQPLAQAIVTEENEEEETRRENYHKLNPASTTSSLQLIERA